jgi:hypothetical protein
MTDGGGGDGAPAAENAQPLARPLRTLRPLAHQPLPPSHTPSHHASRRSQRRSSTTRGAHRRHRQPTLVCAHLLQLALADTAAAGGGGATCHTRAPTAAGACQRRCRATTSTAAAELAQPHGGDFVGWAAAEPAACHHWPVCRERSRWVGPGLCDAPVRSTPDSPLPRPTNAETPLRCGCTHSHTLPIALGGNLGGVTSWLLGLDGGQLAASVRLDQIVPVLGMKRCYDSAYGFGECSRTRGHAEHVPSAASF